jgi:hypothetical protein
VTCSGDPVAAVLDALLKQPIDQIVVCDPRRRLRPRQIDLAHRAKRATGLPVIHAPVAPAHGARRRCGWLRLWRGSAARFARRAGRGRSALVTLRDVAETEPARSS